MNQLALITGASSGIGEALAKEHAMHGGDLVIVARRRERLESLKKTLESQYPAITVYIVVQDLSEVGAAQKVFEVVQNLELTIDILINNAAFGLHGNFYEQPWETLEDMLRVNVETLTHLTHLILPQMVKNGKGNILNVASVAGLIPGPLQALYYATKAYVVSLSEALANEVKDKGVTVSTLCPGYTRTEFAKVGNLDGVRGFRFGSMSSEEVAQFGYSAMERGKSLVVPGLLNKFMAHILIPITPRFIKLYVSRKFMEK